MKLTGKSLRSDFARFVSATTASLMVFCLYSVVDGLMTVISGETGYERVIFDIGFLTDTALYLLYCCDRIYIPKAQSLWEEKQANSLERLLVKEGLEEVLESIRYIAV